ncbi:hypothetical protein B5X24_HaOG202070 [Helicoverpa armigera]|uniref:Uncharacterized protein n=1 Tax=Helicoverpa armigera TaxID=29058 RepID=A0A2W1BY09_HELAM|nr:hypothetical protein B5X24_HaOG202070 [Helicoverpa armigera]
MSPTHITAIFDELGWATLRRTCIYCNNSSFYSDECLVAHKVAVVCVCQSISQPALMSVEHSMELNWWCVGACERSATGPTKWLCIMMFMCISQPALLTSLVLTSLRGEDGEIIGVV